MATDHDGEGAQSDGRPMKIAIVGAGAIGGYLGAKLALAGEDVTLIARGPHLAAIQQYGLKLITPDGTEATATGARAMSDMAKAGQQDVVFLTLKTHSVPAVAPAMRALDGPDTMVVTMQNGIPWWYFRKHGGPYEGTRIETVDPGGIVEANTEIDRVIASVVYPAAELAAPGVVRHIEGDRFSLGELDGVKTERIQMLAQTLIRAGLKAPIRPRIRAEIWVKLWGNLAFNPISALTRATLVDICQYPPTRDLARTMMTEAQTIAEKLEIKFPISIEQRIAGAEEVGAHKTSMLQDIETGRPTEVDAIVGSVAELGRLTGTPTPAIDAIYASVKLLEKTLRADS
ncbi:MAG: 2-dehydropantoate 2-reductase [Thermomicrobiales bacterium]